MTHCARYSAVMSTEVAPNVYQKRLAHSKVVYVDDVNLLVDTGPDTAWEDLTSFVDAHGDVDRLYLSHDHGDHVGCAERVIERYEPEVFVPENEPFEGLDLPGESVTAVSDGEEFLDGIVAVEVPGHTEGICVLHLPASGVLLCIDVLDGADRRGLPAGYLLPPPAVYSWDSNLAESNLERLLELSFETAVVTHGSNVEEDPRGKLERFLDFQNHYRAELLEELS